MKNKVIQFCFPGDKLIRAGFVIVSLKSHYEENYLPLEILITKLHNERYYFNCLKIEEHIYSLAGDCSVYLDLKGEFKLNKDQIEMLYKYLLIICYNYNLVERISK